MDGHPRAKPDKPSGRTKEIGAPLRLYVGVIFLIIGSILYLIAK